MSVTPLPTAPSRTQSQDTFDTNTDAFIGALPTMVTQFNADIAIMNSNTTAAAVSATSAAASAVSANAVAGAAKWVSGTTYAEGNAAWSPANYLTYRRIVAGAGTTDPSLDPTNWAKIVSDMSDERNPRAMAQSVELQAATGQPNGQAGVNAPDSTHHNFASGDFTIVWEGSLPSFTPAGNQPLISKGNGTTTGFYLGISTTGKVFLRITSTVYVPSVAAPPLTAGATHHFVASVSQSTLAINFYIDGVFWTSSTLGGAVSVSDTARLQVLGLATVRYNGSCKTATLFNRALSASEVQALYLNGASYADKWGSQTGQTSGTLVVGKRYRITTFVAGDSFTNVGAASNATGVEFVATGTTPTTWANGSTLNGIGCVLALESEGVQPNQWHDSSTNEVHAVYPTSGFSFTRLGDVGLYHWNIAITGDTTLTSIVPSNYELEKIVFKNSTATALSVRLGTTASGTEVFGLTALNTTASFGGYKTIVVNQAFSSTAATTLYLSSTAWSTASITATFFFRRVT